MGNYVYRFEGYCQPEQETPAATKQGISAWLQTSLVTLSLHEAGVAESNHDSKSSVWGSLLRQGLQFSFVYFKHAPNMKIHTQVWWNVTSPLSPGKSHLWALALSFLQGDSSTWSSCPKDKPSETPMLCEQQSPYYWIYLCFNKWAFFVCVSGWDLKTGDQM